MLFIVELAYSVGHIISGWLKSMYYHTWYQHMSSLFFFLRYSSGETYTTYTVSKYTSSSTNICHSWGSIELYFVDHHILIIFYFLTLTFMSFPTWTFFRLGCYSIGCCIFILREINIAISPIVGYPFLVFHKGYPQREYLLPVHPPSKSNLDFFLIFQTNPFLTLRIPYNIPYILFLVSNW